MSELYLFKSVGNGFPATACSWDKMKLWYAEDGGLFTFFKLTSNLSDLILRNTRFESRSLSTGIAPVTWRQ